MDTTEEQPIEGSLTLEDLRFQGWTHEEVEIIMREGP